MKVVGLVSGGKDSCYNMMKCVEYGHEIVAIANLHPPESHNHSDEMDSYCFQTVGFSAVEEIAKALDVPLYRVPLEGKSVMTELNYSPCGGDEVNDLKTLLELVLKHHPDVKGVSSGAILSNYQRSRVEYICDELNLVSLAYLWQRNQKKLLKEMIDNGLDAILIKVASMGLKPRLHLGKSLAMLYPLFCNLNQTCDLNICGEGGEYETLTLDCPLFKKKLSLTQFEIVDPSSDPFSPVGHLHIRDVALEDKPSSSDPKPTSEPTPTPAETSTTPPPPTTTTTHTTTHTTPTTCHMTIECVASSSSSSSSSSSFPSPPPSALQGAIETLDKKLISEGFSLGDIVHVTLHIPDMSFFKQYNEVYKQSWKEINQKGGKKSILYPSRACVTFLDKKNSLFLEVFAFKGGIDKSLHVQSVSCWAPPSIGPYSQSTTKNRILRLAGNIGLFPPTVSLLSSPPSSSLSCGVSLSKRVEFETWQALDNIAAVLNCVNSHIKNALSLEIYYVENDHTNEITKTLNQWFEHNIHKKGGEQEDEEDSDNEYYEEEKEEKEEEKKEEKGKGEGEGREKEGCGYPKPVWIQVQTLPRNSLVELRFSFYECSDVDLIREWSTTPTSSPPSSLSYSSSSSSLFPLSPLSSFYPPPLPPSSPPSLLFHSFSCSSLPLPPSESDSEEENDEKKEELLNQNLHQQIIVTFEGEKSHHIENANKTFTEILEKLPSLLENKKEEKKEILFVRLFVHSSFYSLPDFETFEKNLENVVFVGKKEEKQLTILPSGESLNQLLAIQLFNA